MKKLKFELSTDSHIDKIWTLVTDINSYHKYIKFCHSSKLIGDFKVNSVWYDWSTVVYIPFKVNHKIIKIIPNKKIVYSIKLPFGEILQTISIFKGKKTKIKLEVIINFPNSILDRTLGNIIYIRNRQMLEETIKNYKKVLLKNA